MADWDPEANELYLKAVEIASPENRRRFVDGACAGKPDLRARVDRLIRAGEQAGSFLEHPAVDSGPTSADGPWATGEASSSPGAGAVVGPYKLVQEIGEGGMGTVYLAQQTEPVRRVVALKLVKPGMDSRQVLARFEAERQALALMDHPNIARVLDAGATAEGRPYFVMELVKGVPITRYCDDHRLGVRDRLELFADVCRAVQHAHQKGVIHRDLKPSYVLVAPYDGRPVVKVIDFGIAKAAGQPLTDRTLVTGLGAVVGTPEYMSPEQAELNNLDIDTRSDVYALGVLLYELLTGTTPLTHVRVKQAALLEILRVIREEEPPRPSARLSGTEALPSIAAVRGVEPSGLSRLVRGELDWIVMKALEKDRNRRYETANGLAQNVGRYLHDETVQACPPSAWYRLRKFTRRNKGVLTATAVVFLALVAGTAVATWQAVRATLAERRALTGFRMARDAVDRSFTQVSQSPLLKAQGLEKFCRDQLRSAREFYERFVSERFERARGAVRPGAGPPPAGGDRPRARRLPRRRGIRGESGRAPGRVGGRVPRHSGVPTRPGGRSRHAWPGRLGYRAVGRGGGGLRTGHRPPEGAGHRAPGIAALPIRVGENPGHLQGHAHPCPTRGSCGDEVAAGAGSLERRARGRRPSLEHRSLLAEIYMNLGQVDMIKGQFDESEMAYKEAIRLYEERVRGRPDARPEDWQALARSQALLGRIYTQTPG